MRRITTFWDFAAYDLLLLVGPKLPSIGQSVSHTCTDGTAATATSRSQLGGS